MKNKELKNRSRRELHNKAKKAPLFHGAFKKSKLQILNIDQFQNFFKLLLF